MNLDEFSVRITKIAAEIPVKVSDSVVDAAMAGSKVMVNSTPVLTGRARGGWRASLGAPGSEGSTVLDPSSDATHAAMVSASDKKKPGEPLALYNNVPYIIYLDAGSSAKAPAGMTSAGLREIMRKLRSIKLGLGK